MKNDKDNITYNNKCWKINSVYITIPFFPMSCDQLVKASTHSRPGGRGFESRCRWVRKHRALPLFYESLGRASVQEIAFSKPSGA